MIGDNGLCSCPPIVVVEPEVPNETTEDDQEAVDPSGNPNCTTGNRNACERGNGVWDF